MNAVSDASPPARRAWLSPGMGYMVAGAFFFSLMSLGVKLAGRRIPTQEIVLVRGVLNVVMTYALLRRAEVRPWGSRPVVLVLRGLLGFAALSCLYYALVHLPLADATVLQYTNPLWAGLIAWLMLREELTRRQLASALASIGGVVLMTRPSFLFGEGFAGLDPVAVGIALLGAVFSAFAYVTVRQLGQTEHSLVIVFYFTLVMVPAALPAVLREAVWPTPGEWIVLLGIGLTAQAGQVYLTRGLQLEPAGRATAVAYVQVVFAAVWGILFFAEIPDPLAVVGALVVLASTYVLATARPRAVPRPRMPGVADAPG